MFSRIACEVTLALLGQSAPQEAANPQEILDAWSNAPEEPTLMRVFMALAVVLLLIFLFALVARRFFNGRLGRGPGKGSLKVLETLPLGGKKAVHLLQVHDRNLVIGVAGDRIDLLTELSEEEIRTPDLQDNTEQHAGPFGKILSLGGKKRPESRVKG